MPMLAQLSRALHDIRRAGVPVNVAFEWPRHADGWKVEAVQDLVCDPGTQCDFDGCQYGLTD
eukprot:8052034-Heterocapsa_arctica.AAC.1